MTTLLDTLTVPWVALPHRMEVILDDRVPDGYAVMTAYALVVDRGGRTLLTRVDEPGRGWEVPGGHVEAGESPAAAAARELAEETGFVLDPGVLRLFGGQKLTLLEEPPAGHRYPARDFLAFFTARWAGDGPATVPQAAFESGAAGWFGRDEVAVRCAGAAWLPLHAALFG